MNSTSSIVDTLWRVHNNPGGGHEAELADVSLSLAEGQQCQLALLDRWLDQGERLGGWKIGMTSGASRNAMGDGIRPFGFILASRIKTSADRLSVATLARGQIENELCFRMGTALGAGADRGSAAAAVAAVLPAFEINQKRLAAGAEPGLRVADNLSNWGILVGDPVAPPPSLAGLTVTLRGENGVIERVASEGHIDDHYESLATLARGLAACGRELEPGQLVITGAYGKTPFAPGSYRGAFEPEVGTVTANLVP